MSTLPLTPEEQSAVLNDSTYFGMEMGIVNSDGSWSL